MNWPPEKPMQIIPVLDVQHGTVVRGVGGRRDEYRPIVSMHSHSSQPLEVATALQQRFGFTHFYLADLDAIAGLPLAISVYHELQTAGFSLAVDAGVRRLDDALALVDCSVADIVIGLESVSGPDELAEICTRLAAKRILFSLDLKNGIPLVASDEWRSDDAWQIAERAIACGVREMIVLDLAQVGENRGVGALDLCRRLIEEHSQLKVITGGGVRGRDDLEILSDIGVYGVLVASALHDGRLTQNDVDYFSGRNSQNAD